MPTDSEIASYLCSLEQSLLRADVRRGTQIANLLADDFIEFGSSGRTFNRDEIILAVHAEAPEPIEISDIKAKRLAENVYLITYRACRDSQIRSLRSSVWVRQDPGTWQIVFHQGTRCP